MCKPAQKSKRSLRHLIWWQKKDSRLDGLYDDLYESLNEDTEIVLDECRPLVEEEIEDMRFGISESPQECRREKKRRIHLREEAYRQISSEETFDAQMQKALKEAEEMIKGLLLKGCPTDLILSWLNQNVKLSRLRITRQFKILLVDYDKEIKMGPLPKTVFLFFLRHPEGVMFSHLQDYKKELSEIYGRVCNNDDPQKMEESIARLTDPLDNSICEKCAAVKKAFVLNVSDTVAKNYYINGTQGEKKGISLDRNLVEWECEL